jgi:hypothetical protein
MRRIFGLLALAAAGAGVWVLFAGPGIDPQGVRALSEAPIAQSAWALGLLMGLTLAWLAAKDWSAFPAWLRLQRRRLGLLILGGLLASVLFLF